MTLVDIQHGIFIISEELLGIFIVLVVIAILIGRRK